MTKFFKVVLLTVFAPWFCYAQANYKPAYVVNLKGDTLKGAIDYKEWAQNPHHVKFRSYDGIIAEYDVKNARAFGVNGVEHYRSYTVPLSQDADAVSTLTSSLDTGIVVENVFLKVLTQGKYLTLYSYTDFKLRLFTQAGMAIPIPLVKHRYLDNQNRTVEVNTYIVQLKRSALTYNPSDMGILRQIDRTNYTTNEVSAIVDQINGASLPNLALETRRAGANFFIGAGATSSRVTGTFKDASGAGQRPGVTSISTFINAGIDICLNKLVAKWFFRTEFGYSAAKAMLEYDETKASVGRRQTLSYRQNNYSVSEQIIYNVYNTPFLKFYLGAGGAVNFSNYDDAERVYADFLDQKEIARITVQPKLKSVYYTAITRAGVILNRRIEVHVSYIPPISLSDHPDNPINVSVYKAGVNLLIGR